MKSLATFGTGCFWCTEACFKELNGVIEVRPGYAGGKTHNPSYEQICTGQTGHAEVIRIVYDEKIISFEELLRVFWYVHDPTQLNRQGNDIGTQYRSVIFYHSDEQKELSLVYKSKLDEKKVWNAKIVTEISAINNFSFAESYHQDYFNKNPQNMYCQSVVRPKVEQFKSVFSTQLK
ncbi:MAG: peptide-methionine (S)-S-oxide reductase [Crocinitomicaceae bacterium]|nr:peptide-methionine (S)-S-oxide reductase [Crocinitomicaceae bacterium]|tara:strand:+ start:464 stop:994 length:531 start_codon:yes stop_codon:yes gene_type:complete